MSPPAQPGPARRVGAGALAGLLVGLAAGAVVGVVHGVVTAAHEASDLATSADGVTVLVLFGPVMGAIELASAVAMAIAVLAPIGAITGAAIGALPRRRVEATVAALCAGALACVASVVVRERIDAAERDRVETVADEPQGDAPALAPVPSAAEPVEAALVAIDRAEDGLDAIDPRTGRSERRPTYGDARGFVQGAWWSPSREALVVLVWRFSAGGEDDVAQLATIDGSGRYAVLATPPRETLSARCTWIEARSALACFERPEGGGRPRVSVHPATGGEGETLAWRRDVWDGPVEIAPDGDAVYYGAPCDRGGCVYRSALDGRREHLVATLDGRPCAIAASARGIAVVTSSDPEGRVCSALHHVPEGGEPRLVATLAGHHEHATGIASLALSLDGSSVAALADDGVLCDDGRDCHTTLTAIELDRDGVRVVRDVLASASLAWVR